MSGDGSGVVIDYSIVDTNEEYYEYNEDVCFIAATRESADAFRGACGVNFRAARIDSVTWDDHHSHEPTQW